MIKNDTWLGTYSASTSIPSVLAAKCDSTTCTATTTDVTTLKNCFTNPSAAACTGILLMVNIFSQGGVLLIGAIPNYK